MKVKNIVILTLVFLMLFLNVTSVFAGGEIQNNIEIIDVDEQKTIENDISVTNSIEVDTSSFNGYIKPSTEKYNVGDGIYQDDEFASYYFYNLKDNFGYNTHGSCGYVAVAMLLSYYDTYWDDSIIDGCYDREGTIVSNLDLINITNSPGILREPDEVHISETETLALGNLNAENYWNYIESNWQAYFQLYLIKIAEEQYNMYHDTVAVLEECGIVWEIDTEFPCASAMLHQKSVLEYYLYNERGYTEDEVSLQYANTDVRDFAISKIKEGQPVLLFLGSPTGCHFVVAYDLDDKDTEDISDDDIYAHYGWKAVEDVDGNVKDAMHINIDTDEFPWLVSAMAINFNNEHVCSNNFRYNGKEYCSCFAPPDIHPAHECRYYKAFDEIYHMYACDCNPSEDTLFEHDMRLSTSVEPGKHGYKCHDCGYVDESTVGTHSYDYWVYLNSTTHIRECDCGARGTTTASHAFRTSRVSPDLEICVDCGYTKKIGSDSGNIIMSITKESLNGSYILSDGTIMLVDEDIEAYLNGTLVFYDKDNVPQIQ